MQTTLLGIGITLIVALVTALVGPLFVDWSRYRQPIEIEASRVLGAPVRVSGPIDVRLLPTPSLALSNVEIGDTDAGRKLAARSLFMEFGVGTLIRGEFRANEATIDGLDLAVGVDRSGGLVMPSANLAFDPDRLAIDRLTIVNGHIGLNDAASGARVALENVNLTGEMRSLLGPFKAEGSFATKGETYNFRVAAGRRGEDGGMKLRLAVDPAEKAPSFETDGALWFEAGSPRYDGAFTLARPAAAAPRDGRAALNDAWKIAGKLKASAARATVEQLEINYGQGAQALRWSGSATMDFGHEPRVAALLAARQVDLDRLLSGPDPKGLPFAAIKSLTDGLAGLPLPSLPVRVTFGIDSLVAGGGTVTAVRGDVEHGPDGWNVAALDLRAPGATAMHVAGHLALADRNIEFAGPVKVDSGDPALFFAWIEGKSARDRPPVGPMRAGGTVTLGGERIAVDGLDAEIDRKALQGRLAYRFATGNAPARLDATLNAADLDVDRSLSVGKALFASTSFDAPGEIALALDLGHASYAGIEARRVNAALSYDHSGVKIERLSIADLGGSAIDASGRVDNAGAAPRGAITLSLAAPRLEGLTTLAAKFVPAAAEPLRKHAARITPLHINAKIDIAPGTGTKSAAKVRLDGKIAGIDLNLEGAGAGDLSDPTAATLRIEGRLIAADARALATLIGLDAVAVAESHPAHLTFQADGSLPGALRVDAKLAGADLNASASGTVTTAGDAALDVALRAADTRLPRRAGTGPVAIDLRGHATVHGDEVALTDLTGKVAGATMKGRLALGLGQEPLRIDGSIEADRLNAGELIAIYTGAPRPAHGASIEWAAEPFGPVALPAMQGHLVFRAGTAQWGIGPPARDLAGAIDFEDTGFSLADVTGTLAEGRLGFSAQVRRDAGGVALRSHVELARADLPSLLAGALRAPAVGRVWLTVDAQGLGLSPASLIGALAGTGTVAVNGVEIRSLDPTAIDAVIAAIERDRALSGNPARVAELAANGLEIGKLKLPFAAAPLAIANGRARVQFAAPAHGANLAGSLSLGLPDGQLDAEVVMTDPPRKNAPAGEPPALEVAFKGPLTAARRSVDVTSLIDWVTARALDEDAKMLENVQQERQRLEAAAEALQRQNDATLTPAGAVPPAKPTPQESEQVQALGLDPPPAVEINPVPLPQPAPPPPRRGAPAQAPPPAQRPPLSPLDWFLNGGH